MFYIPIIGALLEATGAIIEKKILRKHKIDYKNYTVYGFLAIVLVMLPFIYFFWQVGPEATKIKNLLIFFLIILVSIIANLLSFYALKRKDLSEIEPIRLMQPLFTILLAFIFSFFFQIYSSEKNYSILLLALIASFALILSHIEKKHLAYNKYLIAALIGSFLFSLELVISKSILSYYNPFTFYFLRCLCIFIITWTIFQPKIKSIEKKTKYYILITGIIWAIYRVILYHGYLKIGIVFTTMLFILSPIFVYLFASIFLKEKIKLKQIISSIIIIICVIIAMIIGD